MPLAPRLLALVAVLVAAPLLVSTGCGEKQRRQQTPDTRDPLSVPVTHDREVVLSSSRLDFEIGATDRLVVDRARIRIVGQGGDFPDFDSFYVGETVRPDDVGDVTVRLSTGETIWEELDPSDGDVFRGRVVVELYDEIGLVARGVLEEQVWTFRRDVRPEVESFDVGEVHVNSEVSIEGAGFLRPDEGQTVAVVESGTLEQPDGGTRDLAGEKLPVRWEGRRDRASLVMSPSVLGVQQSSFEGSLRFENQVAGGSGLPGSDGHDFEGSFKQSYIAELTPGAASRSEIVDIEGRGFVEGGEGTGTGMVLRFEGTFDPRAENAETISYEGDDALERAPHEVVAEDHIRQPIWYSVEDRELQGFGAQPGEFSGTITPILFGAEGRQTGLPWEGTFEVEPTKQVVYLKYLPAFSKALEKFGLRNVEGAIRERVARVIRRDYSDYHVEVVEEKPRDILDYATVELGGPDPTGTRAFGYDNSFNGVAKDTGNLFLADYLGGVSVQAAEEFNNPYGGIFISSFTFFSPTLTEDNPNAHPAFDRILKPFMPALGGRPVRGTEWPDGPRSDAIAEAVHMVGSVIGNTVTHEVGHSMGMTYVPRDDTRPTNIFHNEIPGPFIMDPGAERPFEERAELPGAERGTFNDLNREYLERILPKPD